MKRTPHSHVGAQWTEWTLLCDLFRCFMYLVSILVLFILQLILTGIAMLFQDQNLCYTPFKCYCEFRNYFVGRSQLGACLLKTEKKVQLKFRIEIFLALLVKFRQSVTIPKKKF